MPHCPLPLNCNFNLIGFGVSEVDCRIRTPVFSPALSEAAREWHALGRSYCQVTQNQRRFDPTTTSNIKYQIPEARSQKLANLLFVRKRACSSPGPSPCAERPQAAAEGTRSWLLWPLLLLLP
jgi:hypothetical protein